MKEEGRFVCCNLLDFLFREISHTLTVHFPNFPVECLEVRSGLTEKKMVTVTFEVEATVTSLIKVKKSHFQCCVVKGQQLLAPRNMSTTR